MASGAKRKTTMAKMMRENKVREKAMMKRARKDARKLEASMPPVEVDAEAEFDTDGAPDTDAPESDAADEPEAVAASRPSEN